MSKAIKDTAYLHLTTYLRARESRMLTREKMERMLEAPSYEEGAKMLQECGYEDFSKMSASQVEKALADHRTKIFAELHNSAPEPLLVEAFRLKYDYHNAKALIKAEGVGSDGSRILSDSGNIPTQQLIDNLTAEENRDLPGDLANAIDEARSVLARTENPQLADFIMDNAYFAKMLEIADETENEFLEGYIKLMIDCSNLRAAVRTMRMGRDMDFLRTALVGGGNVDIDRLSAAAIAGEGINAIFAASPLERASELGTEALVTGSLTEFEKECDNAQIAYLEKAKLISFGAPPVVSYLAALENEITAARMILTGRLGGIEPGKIRERLRDSYA